VSWLRILAGEATDNAFLNKLTFLPICLDIAMVICAFNFLAFLFRVLRGPAVADRAVAMDSCGTAVMALIVIYSMRQGTDLYMSCVLVIAILGFIGMVALSKYIQSGNIVNNTNIILNVTEAEDLKEEADAAEVLHQKMEQAIQKTAEKNVRNMRKQLNRKK
jgi:multisubunit Na+/H+ antiporter MnhF subunit